MESPQLLVRAILLGKATLTILFCAQTSRSWAHVLETDASVIECIDAELMLPSELIFACIFGLIFGFWIAENLDQAVYFFSGVTVGIGSFSMTGARGVDVTLLTLLIASGVVAWMCIGRTTPVLVSAIAFAIFSAALTKMIFSVQADLSNDQLIRTVASVSLLFSASFFGGLFKKIQMWFPKQAPIGIRVLSSWMVAVIAIQLAMSVMTP